MKLPLRFLMGAFVASLSSLVFAADMPGEPHVYKKVGERELRLYVFKPQAWKSSDQRPAIVFFHGGGWSGGAPTAFAGQSEYLATRGMVAISVQYRLMAKDANVAPFPCMQDAKSAMRWVRAHAKELGIDPARIAAGGGSAGGHLAAFTGLVPGYDDPADDLKVPAKPAALVLFNPFVGFQLDATNEARATERFGPETKAFIASTPANHVAAGAPPTIIFHGAEDAVVLPDHVRKFAADMKQVGVRCEAVFYDGQAHGFFNRGNAGGKYYYATLVATDRFLASLGWLQGPPTLTESSVADASASASAPKVRKKKNRAN